MTSEDPSWIVAPDSAKVEIAIGKDAKLSPELRDALDALANALEGEGEVRGYATCMKVTFEPNCDYYMKCQGVTLD